MGDRQIEEISASLSELAGPATSPRELLKAVRKRHPEATKKVLMRAAFHSVIANADNDLAKARRLQDFAVSARGPDADV